MLHKGELHVRAGPMFSGKSTWLNLSLTRLADLGYSVVKIMHKDDQRDSTTHNSSYKTISPKIQILCTKDLNTLDVSRYDVVGIDEGQFFTGLYEFVKNLVEHYGMLVKVTGLDGDSSRQKFGEVLDLIPISNSFKKMNAYCRDCLMQNIRVEAPFTRCLVPKNGQVLVGAANEYAPVCRMHYE